MAKAPQRSRRRTKANARRRVRGTAGLSHQSVAAQNDMLLTRLRTHAKWVFVLVAVIFLFSFVVAGVGSGSTGVSDMFSQFGSLFGGGGTNALKDAQKQVDKAGNDPAKLAPALSVLGRAQAAKGDTSAAAATYARYFKLRPKDARAHEELARAYQADADTASSDAASAALSAADSAPSTAFTAGLVTDPIQQSLHQDAVTTATDAWKRYADLTSKQIAEFKAGAAIAKGDTRDSMLVQIATAAGTAMQAAIAFSQEVPDSPEAATAQARVRAWAASAQAADKQLLVLHPHDSLTKNIKQQLASVQAYLTPPAK